MEEDNTQYYNDEWNLTKDQLLIKVIEEFPKKVKEKFNSKNDKPDGRRYKK